MPATLHTSVASRTTSSAANLRTATTASGPAKRSGSGVPLPSSAVPPGATRPASHPRSPVSAERSAERSDVGTRVYLGIFAVGPLRRHRTAKASDPERRTPNAGSQGRTPDPERRATGPNAGRPPTLCLRWQSTRGLRLRVRPRCLQRLTMSRPLRPPMCPSFGIRRAAGFPRVPPRFGSRLRRAGAPRTRFPGCSRSSFRLGRRARSLAGCLGRILYPTARTLRGCAAVLSSTTGTFCSVFRLRTATTPCARRLGGAGAMSSLAATCSGCCGRCGRFRVQSGTTLRQVA